MRLNQCNYACHMTFATKVPSNIEESLFFTVRMKPYDGQNCWS
ncbi:MAG: hypothetical protein ABS960_14445 [Solibacillus isronensis]